jgi:spore germination cell wall hydrolase CwlJ-like protein
MTLYCESLYWLAICIYHEGRGEPLEGQRAIAHVILTRALQRKKSVKEIVQEPYQFSWFNDGLPDDIKNHDSFIECMKSATSARDERLGGNDGKNQPLSFNRCESSLEQAYGSDNTNRKPYFLQF